MPLPLLSKQLMHAICLPKGIPVVWLFNWARRISLVKMVALLDYCADFLPGQRKRWKVSKNRTWIWANSGREWKTGKPVVLQSLPLNNEPRSEFCSVLAAEYVFTCGSRGALEEVVSIIEILSAPVCQPTWCLCLHVCLRSCECAKEWSTMEEWWSERERARDRERTRNQGERKTRARSERATETPAFHRHTHSYTFTHQQRRSGLIPGLELCAYNDMPKV